MNYKYQFFQLLVVIDSIYSSLFYAVKAAFRVDLDYSNHDQYLDAFDDPLIDPIPYKIIQNDFYEMWILESVFLAAIILKFFTNYTDEFTGNSIKDLTHIRDRYIKGSLTFDLITIFPFIFRFKFSCLFLLIKYLRLVNLKYTLNVNLFME